MTDKSPVRGDKATVRVERVAHGGHCVARHEGRVLFVRHAIPGEVVDVVITGEGAKGRYLRADAVAVVEPSDDRVDPPCAHSGAGKCGGCDWQHVSLEAQRRMKSDVLREQLTRLGGIESINGVPLEESVRVEAVAGDIEGLSWRTRVRYAVDEDGSLGFRRSRSHRVQVIDSCPLVTDAVDSTDVTWRQWQGADEVTVVASSLGDRAVVIDPPGSVPSGAMPGLPEDVVLPGRRGRGWVREFAGGREWRVQADGFWQVHPGAADVLVDAVREALAPRPGEHLLDLYSGVGLFAGCLAADLGPEGRVDAVEFSVLACGDARRNLHDLPQVRIHAAPVESWLAASAAAGPEGVTSVDIVVLDPPRNGAGAGVLDRVMALTPRAVAYVACDPASLGRDIGHMAGAGWTVGSVRGFDLFPMTSHLEAVALLLPPR